MIPSSFFAKFLSKEAIESFHIPTETCSFILSNAILSAIGKEDIGYYFPDNIQKTKNMCSMDILDFALSEMKKQGYHISNVVCDILLQKPKLRPYREEIKTKLSQVLSLDESRIGLQANTGEHVDAVGNSKAVVVYSQVLLIKD